MTKFLEERESIDINTFSKRSRPRRRRLFLGFFCLQNMTNRANRKIHE